MENNELLKKRIHRCLNASVKWDGVVYRLVEPKYANGSDLLSGEGSAIYGGRWNPKGIKTVYGSVDPETALRESLAGSRHYGFEDWHRMPLQIVAIKLRLFKMLDLTSGRIRQKIFISKKRMEESDWRNDPESITSLLGLACFELKFEGMIAPSPEGLGRGNLVWFPDNLGRKSLVEKLERY